MEVAGARNANKTLYDKSRLPGLGQDRPAYHEPADAYLDPGLSVLK